MEGQSKTRILHTPHLLLSIAASVGKPVINYVKTGVHDGFLIFLNPNFEIYFMFEWLESFRSKWQKYGQPGSQVNLNSEIVKNQVINLPSLLEQNEVSRFLNKFNDLIELHQRKNNRLKQLKKLYLNVMFPNNNETTPRLRFNSFKQGWEQRKLGDFISIKSGWSPSNFKEIKETNANLYIKVDDLNYSSREQMNSKLQVENNSRFIKIKKYSTIFPKRGAAIMTNKVRYLKLDAYMDTNMMALEPLKINDLFLYTFIEKEGLFRIADTSTIPQINNGHINPYPINLPNEAEQNIIGIMFESIDKTIELHQKKVNNLNKLKKLYLRKMFL